MQSHLLSYGSIGLYFEALTDRGGDVSGEDLLALPDGQLRPQLQPQVGELDIVGVIEAGVVDEAVDRVQRHTGAATVM